MARHGLRCALAEPRVRLVARASLGAGDVVVHKPQENSGSTQPGKIGGTPSLTFNGKTGGRFSRNEVTPSRASSLGPRTAMPRESTRCATHRVVGAEHPPQHLAGQRHRHRRRVLGDLERQGPRRRQQVVGRVHAAHEAAGQRLGGREDPAR